MERNNDFLVDRYIRDLCKPDVDCFERAAIIAQHIDKSMLSVRKFALKYNIPRGTLEDWLLWNRIDKKKYDALKSKGVNHLSIYNSLRESKTKPKEEIDFVLVRIRDNIKGLRYKNIVTSPVTEKLIHETINELNYLQSEIIRKQKKGEKTQ